MTKDDLIKIISAGETETQEFKTSFSRETIESCGAFANTRGGRIFIGVSGDGSLLGVQTGIETFNYWRNQIAQSSATGKGTNYALRGHKGVNGLIEPPKSILK